MSTTDRYNAEMITSEDATSSDMAMTVAAVFTDKERARDAAHRLHDEGFGDTWIGLTRIDEAHGFASPSETAGETRVESENWFTRFFGEGDESLHEALVRRGVNEVDARAAAAGPLPAHSAILTVDGANHPELAAQLISECSGQLITRGFGATGYGTTGMYGMAPASGATGSYATTDAYGTTSTYRATEAPSETKAYGAPELDEAPASRTTSLIEDGVYNSDRDALRTPRAPGANDAYDVAQDVERGQARVADAGTYDDYGRFRAGTPVDESTRLQLREERLRVDKSLVSRGDATIGTDVVTEKHEIDVPLIREELFIERRSASNSAVSDSDPIGDQGVIRIPLSQEKLTISKTPVVTEEVIIGKRRVEDVQHVSETTRKEQLNVRDLDDATPERGRDQSRA